MINIRKEPNDNNNDNNHNWIRVAGSRGEHDTTERSDNNVESWRLYTIFDSTKARKSLISYSRSQITKSLFC